jgi:purine-binding chemotaxis protein CheW
MNTSSILLEKHALALENSKDFLTVTIAGQLFGIPVLQVHDVLGHQRVTHIPLAPASVSGALNLRGRIVTAIDVRTCLGLPARGASSSPTMSVVVENEGELFSLLIDHVGDVLSLKAADFEKNPSTLDPLWRSVSDGIYRLQDTLLVVLDIPRLLQTIEKH